MVNWTKNLYLGRSQVLEENSIPVFSLNYTVNTHYNTHRLASHNLYQRSFLLLWTVSNAESKRLWSAQPYLDIDTKLSLQGSRRWRWQRTVSHRHDSCCTINSEHCEAFTRPSQGKLQQGLGKDLQLPLLAGELLATDGY